MSLIWRHREREQRSSALWKALKRACCRSQSTLDSDRREDAPSTGRNRSGYHYHFVVVMMARSRRLAIFATWMKATKSALKVWKCLTMIGRRTCRRNGPHTSRVWRGGSWWSWHVSLTLDGCATSIMFSWPLIQLMLVYFELSPLSQPVLGKKVKPLHHRLGFYWLCHVGRETY